MVGSSGAAGFVVMTLFVLFFALYRGWYTPEVVVFLSLLVVWNVGIISTAEALSGFSNPGVLAIGALFVIVASIESSRLADKAAKRVFGLTTSFTSGFLRLLLCGVSMSAFCNNTPVLALLIPVAKDWARTRGYDHAVLLMPLAFACAFGGLLTTVGGGTNLVIQGMLYEAEKEDGTVGPFRLFEPGYVGLPLALAGLGYLLVAAPRLLGASPPVGAGGGAVPGVRDRSGELLTEVEVTEGFKLVGRPFSLVLATLGLPADTLVRVRRRRLPDAGGGSSLPPPKSHDNSSGSGGGGGGGGGGSETCALEAGTEETKGSSWPGLIDETEVGGSSRGPFARRRRTAYRLLENNGDGEGWPGTRSSRAAAGSSIELATLRRAERVADDAAASWEDGGNPARETVGVSDARHDLLHDVPPDTAVRVGDVLVLSAARDVMLYAQGAVFSGRRAGLKVLGVSTLKQSPPPGSVFLELVLSRSSEFLGRTASLDNGFFAARYGCSVVAFRLRGSTEGGVDLTGSGGGGGSGGAGESISFGSGGSSEGNRSSEGIELLEASAACGTSEAAAATTAVGAVADAGVVCGARSTGGDCSSLAGGGGGRSLDSIAPTPFLSSLAGGGSPTTTTPLQPTPEEPGFDAERRYPRHRRRRRRGEAFEAGDVVIVVATERFLEQCSSTTAGEFLHKKLVGRLPEPTGLFHFFPLSIFALMLAWVLLGGVDMIRAVFTACGVLILGGWIDAKQAVGHVNWGLLLLIGSALGFSKAMANSGLADFAGRAVRESGMSVSASLYALFGLTVLCTELISNNAAAALNVPVALSMARELKADYKPFAMTVLVAASCSFLTPIGTPTNTLVWAPGGYKFQDYAKLGAPLTLLFWVTACAAIPRLFPF